MMCRIWLSGEPSRSRIQMTRKRLQYDVHNIEKSDEQCRILIIGTDQAKIRDSVKRLLLQNLKYMRNKNIFLASDERTLTKT